MSNFKYNQNGETMLIKKLANYSLSILLGIQSIISFAEASNYAPTSSISASSIAGELDTAFVADGKTETSWGSGTFPAAWIAFDFGESKAITEINAIVDQKPFGDTTHQVFLDDILSHTWQGNTKTDDTLTWIPPAGTRAQKVRVETIASPSWVGWKEISIDGPDAAPAPNPIQPQKNFAVLANNLDITFTLIEYKSARGSAFFRANLTHIGTNSNNELLWKLRDHHDMSNEHGYTAPSIDELSNLFIKINSISAGQISYWADLEFIGDNGEPGALVWKLKQFGVNN